MDAADFQPASASAPGRSSTGQVTLPRITTTEEQRAEAVEYLLAEATTHKVPDAIRAKIIWARGEPTVLEIGISVEHVDGKRIWLADGVREFTLDGGEVVLTDAARYAVLQEEVAELNENGMLT